MQLQEAYKNNKDTLLFEDSAYINNLKKKLIENFNINPKNIKNNESIKNFDPSILKKINYDFSDKKSKILFSENKNNEFTSLNLKNGHISNIENFDSSQLSISSLQENAALAEKKIKTYENSFKDDYLVDINSVLMNSGYDVQLNEKSINKIIISNFIDRDQTTVFAKNFYTLKKNCRLIIIEKFFNEITSNHNNVNFFEIEKDAEVVHLIFQNNSKKANLQLSSYINCYENSQYKQIIFNTSNASIRNHHYANLCGINSKAELQGVFFGNNNQIIDNKTVVNHLSPSCSSDQRYKGVLTDNARASYLSKTYVDQKAQKTEAYQLSKGILLSENSYFHSKPELKIFADDVKCSHGSTIGPFDENLLFYCRSRGINKEVATSLLINSFISDILKNVEDNTFLSLVDESINFWLNNNNY